MKARYSKTYVSKKGNDTFMYTVEGTPEEIQAFKDAKGEYYREDEEGKPLFFSTNYVGESCPLEITTNGNVVADRSELKKAMSLAAQAGGDLGSAIAAGAANMVLGSLMGAPAQAVAAPAAQSAAPTPQAEIVEPETEEVQDLEDLS